MQSRTRHTAFLVRSAAALAALSGLEIAYVPALAQTTATPAATPAAAQPALPDTPAGRVARGFVDMVNEGTDQAVTRFESTHASAARRGTVEPAERVRRIRDLHEEWGAVRIVKVLAETERTLVVAVSGARSGAMEFEFQMSASEAGKFDGVSIMQEGAMGNRPMPREVSAAQVKDIAESACAALEKSYVFPEIAQKMCASVRDKINGGAYEGVKDEMELARRLTDDFRAISKDKHLRVNFAPAQAAQPAAAHAMMPDFRRENYAFRKVEILPGNIGYVRFDMFVEDEEANKVAAAAMNFLSNSDAIVFDLRYNGGGSPEMIRFITSYLFASPTHLNSMIDREGTVVEEYWTFGEVPGQRPRADVPVYVLTSSRTFSGAEEFSYNLKNLKRATIVGETTGGGAHPVMGERLNDRFTIGIPFMRANNPITKTNWEGTGVEPDIKVPATEALERALEDARSKRAGK